MTAPENRPDGSAAEPDTGPGTEPDLGPDSGFTSQALEGAILGEGPSLTSEAVAEAAGVTLEEARRLWRALGFPDAGDQPAFTEADLEALTSLVGAVDKGAIDFDTAVRLTRAVGQTMARLADWQVATLAARVEQLEAGEEATGSRIGSALRLTKEVGLPFEKLLVYSWRRHLAAAVARVEAVGANHEDLHTTRVTAGFADLVSFTALSNRLDEDRLGDLVEIFESRCADVVAARRGRVIKTLGDSVLFVSDDPVAAMDIALTIVEVIGHDNRLPDVRIGLATGSVVLQLGDVYGPPVNMAARLTAVARRNRVITDAATADLLPDDRFETRLLPARPVRGFGLVEPVAVRRH
jgi:adenylate cyclase